MHRKEWLLCIIILNQNNPRGARFSIAGSYAPAFFKSAQRDMAALWRGQSVLFFQRRQKSMGFVRAASFEEDCAAAVALRELLDKRLCKAPEHYTPEEYDNAVNGTIQRFYPEYWKARERAMAQAVFLPHREDIGR